MKPKSSQRNYLYPLEKHKVSKKGIVLKFLLHRQRKNELVYQ